MLGRRQPAGRSASGAEQVLAHLDQVAQRAGLARSPGSASCSPWRTAPAAVISHGPPLGVIVIGALAVAQHGVALLRDQLAGRRSGGNCRPGSATSPGPCGRGRNRRPRWPRRSGCSVRRSGPGEKSVLVCWNCTPPPMSSERAGAGASPRPAGWLRHSGPGRSPTPA